MLDLDAALAWAGSHVGSPVTAHERLPGGMTSRMLALDHADGSRTVLRLMTNEPWRTHGAELTTRERDAQRFLAGTDVPAPTSLALDADGSTCGVAAHAASNLAVLLGTGPAATFLEEYALLAAEPLDPWWLVMDTVGYLPPPGKPQMFRLPEQVERLDAWLDRVVRLS